MYIKLGNSINKNELKNNEQNQGKKSNCRA